MTAAFAGDFLPGSADYTGRMTCGYPFDTYQSIFYTSSMLKIAVIDGQGGGIGNLIVKMLGEVTAKMASAVVSSKVKTVLLPITRRGSRSWE